MRRTAARRMMAPTSGRVPRRPARVWGQPSRGRPQAPVLVRPQALVLVLVRARALVRPRALVRARARALPRALALVQVRPRALARRVWEAPCSRTHHSTDT